MRPPGFPANETERLAALRALEILDAAPDPFLDSIVKLAARILGVPITLLSLVDERRQWFLARHGMVETETPREVSFCGHVVADGAPLVVPDAHADERFADNPLVTSEPHVRFYAGVPLRTSTGEDLGTLCAIDHRPRVLNDEQLDTLSTLAAMAIERIEARRLRRRLEVKREALRSYAERLDLLIETMAEGLIFLSRDGATSANASAAQILGLDVDQLEGRAPVDPSFRYIREDGSAIPDDETPSRVAMTTGEARRQVILGAESAGRPTRWLNVNAVPLRDRQTKEVVGVITTFLDVTEAKAAQRAREQLSRQERLVTTGTLAAGVGHEINNPLSFILANLEMAIEDLRDIGGGSPSARILELVRTLTDAREGAERVRKIVRGLRALAREEIEPKGADVAQAIDISVQLAGHEIRRRATVKLEVAPTPLVHADESRLSQILVNLLVNAAQAFLDSDAERNLITIRTHVEPTGHVRISVADNGPGIPPSIAGRIFDPFFTTKPVGVGTGLGLSICQSIAHSLGGEIRFRPNEAGGATFEVTLPPARLPPTATLPTEAAPKRRGRVLVVDDEQLILGSVDRILRSEHDVVTVDDPREALRRLEAGESFDVVFCDMMMPHLRGDELHARIRTVRPSLAERFVFITGGATDSRTQRFLDEVPNERLEKPFTVQNLRGVARRLSVQR